MKALAAKIAHGLFGLPLKETSFERRGFRGATDEMRARLELVGGTFLGGYNAALRHPAPTVLVARLNSVDHELRGFAFEGAAMGLALLDALTPWRANRVTGFLNGAGDAHAYMVHVGVGWIWARFPFGLRRSRRRLDPLLSWLAFDGWGFHDGFFHWREYTDGQPPPRRLAGYARRVFDQGLGRSWWFVNGGNPELIARAIAGLPAERRPDMWSGAGLGATYAGIADESALRSLRTLAGPCWPFLAQGAAFAAKARQRAGNLTDYTDLATGVLCRMPAVDAARLCDATLENLSANADPPAFEVWRRRIQNHFRGKTKLLEA